ncbi:MAG: DNA polymerase III subunit delta' [Patescibacteria group bacterium]
MKTHFDRTNKILGHKGIIDYLKKGVINDRLAHAYLFLGRPGLGKKTVAFHFFQSILCHSFNKNISIIPCGECSACREFSRGQYPDFYEIEREAGKKNISIEQIRAIRHHLSLKSSQAGYKFVIINEIEYLTSEAANSFLKTLEEPAPKTIIILIGSNEEAIPKTILSRCQIIRYRSVPEREIREYLKANKNLDTLPAKVMAELSRGCPGRAINLADNPDILEEEERKIEQFLELIKSSLGRRLAEISRLKFSDDMAGEIYSFFDTWQVVSRDLLLNKLGLNDLLTQRSKKVIFSNIGAKKDFKKLQELLDFSLTAPFLLKKNINPRIILENYMLKI